MASVDSIITLRFRLPKFNMTAAPLLTSEQKLATITRLRPRLCEPLSDNKDDEDDKEYDKNAKDLYHQPAIGRHRLEIFDKFGMRCFDAHVGVIHVCINSTAHKRNTPTVKIPTTTQLY